MHQRHPEPGRRPLADLDRNLDECADRALLDGSPGVVAFSGGPDSTALLLALVRRRQRQGGAAGGPTLVAVHVDHAADPDSRNRARRAARLAHRLGVPFVEHRLPTASPAVPGAGSKADSGRRSGPGSGPEATARHRRYRFLARVAAAAGARWIATAHHRDDQAETVLLRLAFGSGLAGLGGIRPATPLPRSVRAEVPDRAVDRVVLLRPLLAVPRTTLVAALERPESQAPLLSHAPPFLPAPPLRPTLDPTNRDLSVPRNRIRHQVLPALEDESRRAGHPPLVPRLARLAARVRRVRTVVDRVLVDHLGLQGLAPGSPTSGSPTPGSATPGSPRLQTEADDAPLGTARLGTAPAAAPLAALAAVDARRLAALPGELLAPALSLLHRAAGAPYPPGREARRELQRQLEAARHRGTRIGCDCGDGLRWESRARRLVLVPSREESPPRGFSYILVVPGEVVIQELGLRLQLHPAPVRPWMYRGSTHRAGLDLPLSPGDEVTIRSRQPGDRIHPLGAKGERKLKEVLVDRRIPRQRRDHIPLLCIGGEIAWVPGVTVAEAFRLPARPPADAVAWVATLRTAETPEP